MTNSLALRIAAILGLLGVALGAFGAHAMNEMLTRNNTREIWETAVLYHFVHALGILAIAPLRPLPAAPVWLFLAGILIFSGSLYILAATNVRWLGAITPIGGISLLAGWLWLAIVGGRIFKP